MASQKDELLALRLQKLEQQQQLFEKKQRRKRQEPLMAQANTDAPRRPRRPRRREERIRKDHGPRNPFLQENVPQAHLPSRNERALVPLNYVGDGSGEGVQLQLPTGAANNQEACSAVGHLQWLRDNPDSEVEDVSKEDVSVASPCYSATQSRDWLTPLVPGTSAEEGEPLNAVHKHEEPSLDPILEISPDEGHGNTASCEVEGGTVKPKHDKDVNKEKEATAKEEASKETKKEAWQEAFESAMAEAPAAVQGDMAMVANVEEGRGSADIHNTYDMTCSQPLSPGPLLGQDLQAYVLLPTQLDHTLQCRIVRNKHGVDKGMFPSYFLYLETPDGGMHFLLAARKRKRSTTSNYLISLDPHNVSRSRGNYVGKLRSNVLGTKFTIFNNGMNPEQRYSFRESAPIREELGVVCYDTNIFGLWGPRKMTVILPGMNSQKQRMSFQPLNYQDTLLGHLERGKQHQLIVLHNKAPLWSEYTGAYVLDFHGRVTQASVKNFQITSRNDPNYLVLQFGRVAPNTFTMDFRYPLCPLQAFAICLSSLDRKLACE
uniref:tubby-related protein 2 n=1 Tax=Jaculus jaculus TaxID=51337 RepID=UPI001E1B1D41|nr:tubby-related protein 2 [Jaculus jaculus]